MTISMIVAVADNYAIGQKNSLPWGNIREDMLWFKEHSVGKVVVMGSSTWDSLPRKPLPNRPNVVLTSRKGSYATHGPHLVLSLPPEQAIETIKAVYPEQEICIIGGAKVYKDFMPYVNKIYLSRIHTAPMADTFLDVDTLMMGQYEKVFDRETEDKHVTFQIWTRR